MEWTKIKPKHFLFNGIPLSQKGALATILCLTAYLERIPAEKEMIRATQYNAYQALSKHLVSIGTSIEYVASKVLEDCERINHKKSISRGTSKTYREKQSSGDVSHDTTDKRREDKRREENIKEGKVTLNQNLEFEKIWLLYKKRDGKKDALKHFKASVKTKEDLDNIKKALDNYNSYIETKKIETQFIKNGSTWFNNWEDWTNYVVLLSEKELKEAEDERVNKLLYRR